MLHALAASAAGPSSGAALLSPAAGAARPPCAWTDAFTMPVWTDEEQRAFTNGDHVLRAEGIKGISARRKHLDVPAAHVWHRLHMFGLYPEWLSQLHVDSVQNTSVSDAETTVEVVLGYPRLGLSTTLVQHITSSPPPQSGDADGGATMVWRLDPSNANDYLQESRGCWRVEPDGGNATWVSYENEMAVSPQVSETIASTLVSIGLSNGEVDLDWLGGPMERTREWGERIRNEASWPWVFGSKAQ